MIQSYCTTWSAKWPMYRGLVVLKIKISSSHLQRLCKVVIIPLLHRDVAQFGSVHVWGTWGRRFKSCHLDQLWKRLITFNGVNQPFFHFLLSFSFVRLRVVLPRLPDFLYDDANSPTPLGARCFRRPGRRYNRLMHRSYPYDKARSFDYDVYGKGGASEHWRSVAKKFSIPYNKITTQHQCVFCN